MTEIRLYNTRSRAKEAFTPFDAQDVRIYVCGPTVYDRAHLGNARPVVVFDTLFRLLRHLYGAAHVRYVRNFTDVDDKINATALARQAAGAPGTLEELIHQRTEETIAWYHADMDALGALRPTEEPRATEYIGAMVAMIQTLIDKGHAYEVSGHVLFDVRSYPDYGRLSGRSVDDMIAGARVEVAPYKRDPMDFVLWKPSDASLPGWESPWGRGRPGWHIECSAMSFELLGSSFDIHGGGIDLQFPHHENEIAQSCCAHPGADFARVWMHNEMLLVEGKKMSKSLGNFFTVRELLDQGVPGEVIRFVMLSTHYRKPMDWTAEKAAEAEATLMKWRRLARNVQPSKPDDFILDALADDLSTPNVLMNLRTIANDLVYRDELWEKRAGLNAELSFTAESLHDDKRRFVAAAQLMGFLEPGMGDWAEGVDLSSLAAKLADLRNAAMASKDFAPVDALKSALIAAGVEVRMSKAGVELVPGPGFDAGKLEGL